MNNKKFGIANRMSFIFFTLYLLTYILLPIIEKNANYLWFLIFPVIFFISLILNLLIKYNEILPSNMEKTSKVAAIANILFNGISLNTVVNSLNAGTTDWEKKKEEIKKYPSITPTWLLCILFATIMFNTIFYILLADTGINISANTLLTYSIISIVFIILGQISSTFALLYNNGKKEAFKFLRTILIVVVALIILAIYSFIANGFSIKDEIQRKNDKQEFQERVENIERTLNNS